MPTVHLDIGLDAGGSKTELLAQEGSDGAAPIALEGPSANLQRQGVDATARVLADLVRRALRHYPSVQDVSVCAGVAGAGRADDQQALARRLEALLSNASYHVRVVHDAAIALEAAFEGGSGLIVIAGTGSVVLARTPDGSIERAGGWGYLIGDEGSGYALGACGLRAVAHAFDGGPGTALRPMLAERHGIDHRDTLIRYVYGEDWSIQEVAPLVLDAAAAGDAVATRIVRDQAAALAEQVRWLVERNASIEPRMALLGGLVRVDYYRSALQDALQERLPSWAIDVLESPPVVGALRLAGQMSARAK